VPFAKPGSLTRVYAVASGKGGVGKSTTALNLALGLRDLGLRVGLLDADIYGPSVPRLTGINEKPQLDGNRKMIPIERFGLAIMSIGFLVEEDTAMIWRGPILSGVIRQFYEQVLWSELDFLLIDLPPGTSDAPLTVLQSLSVDGVVLVTMPQALATMIVRKAANLVHQLKKPILGVIENMSYFVAPDTGKRYDVFGRSYAESVAELAEAPLLARIPIDPVMLDFADTGRIDEFEGPICDTLAEALLAALAKNPKPAETISLI
jgi:ATP-binding protein involved in chromosome partitioning